MDEREHDSKRPRYQNALFRLSAAVSCKDPIQADPQQSRYPEVSDNSAFVAGFAGGE